jgi:V8-like Glu-specific endopeptidase
MKVESIAEHLFFTTIKIDTISTSGQLGAGTGFFFLHRIDGEQGIPIIVTNKHVIERTTGGHLTFHQKENSKPKLGQNFKLAIQDWNAIWIGHPSPDVDIAFAFLRPIEQHIKTQYNIEIFYTFIDSKTLPSPEQEAGFDAIEPVTFIGYPNGIWDSKNFLPVARRGTSASPINVDFEGTPKFIIDASVFGGSSGSPVFILNQGIYTDKLGNSTIGSRVIFVGVVAAVFFRTQLSEIVQIPIPTQTQPMAQQREMLDLGIVFKARTVTEAIQERLKISSQ